MGIYIVAEESGKEHFVEAATAGAAFTTCVNAVSVRVAMQQDVEKHIFKGQQNATPQDTQK